MAKSIQEEIKTYYGGIAKKVTENSKGSCCAGACNCSSDSDLYSAEK